MKKDYTDEELKGFMKEALELWDKKGNKHNNDTPDWRVFELYFPNAIDLVLEKLEIEDSDEVTYIVERINNLY